MTNEGTNRPYAVITGASRGIGAEYARALAACGYDCLLVARDRDKLERLASELRERHRAQVDIALLDLAESEAAHRLYAAARERRPTVDLLINNAGFGSTGDFIAMPMARVQAMLRLHVNTIVESCRLFLPGMVERRAGAVMNVASTAGFMPLAGMTEYAATKTFLIAFSEALAEEVRQAGVRVQVCCPGATLTDFHVTAGSHPKGPFTVQTAEAVVAASLAALGSGRTVVTTHWSGRLTDWLGRWVPRGLLAWGGAWWMRKAGDR
ncbi:MAG: SDR family NAD(P)-dependent oxidoreductase [Nitrospiraceae bacterium]